MPANFRKEAQPYWAPTNLIVLEAFTVPDWPDQTPVPEETILRYSYMFRTNESDKEVGANYEQIRNGFLQNEKIELLEKDMECLFRKGFVTRI